MFIWILSFFISITGLITVFIAPHLVVFLFFPCSSRFIIRFESRFGSRFRNLFYNFILDFFNFIFLSWFWWFIIDLFCFFYFFYIFNFIFFFNFFFTIFIIMSSSTWKKRVYVYYIFEESPFGLNLQVGVWCRRFSAWNLL